MTYPAVRRTFEKSAAIVASLPRSVSVGVCALVSVPYACFLITVARIQSVGQQHTYELWWNYCILALQGLSVVVAVSWGMGVFINRTAQFFVQHGQNPDLRILQESRSTATRQHYLWLQSMVGYTLSSVFYFCFLGRIMVLLVGWFDLAVLPPRIATNVSMRYLEAVISWVILLYYYAAYMMAAPLIVLERKPLRLALSKSYKLIKLLSSDSVSWSTNQRWTLVKLMFVVFGGVGLLDWTVRIAITNAIMWNETQTQFPTWIIIRSVIPSLLHVVILLPLHST